MLRTVKNKHYSCEIEARFIQDRISQSENYFGLLCQSFSAYSRKVARLRDKGDELAKIFLDYSDAEDVNKSLSESLSNFAINLSLINDYGNKRVQILNDKVVNEFAQYDTICKQAKFDVKQIFNVRERELNKRKQLDRVKERNVNRQQILQAETELVKASAEVSRSIHNLEEQTLTFEKQKLHDIKYILMDFIATEMGYHAKALEILTDAYNEIQNVDEEKDLHEFKKSMRMPDRNIDEKKSLFRGSQSLGSISSLFSGTSRKKSPISASRVINKKHSEMSKSEEMLTSKRNIHQSDTSEDDDDEDSEDDTTEISKSNDNVSPFTAKRYLK